MTPFGLVLSASATIELAPGVSVSGGKVHDATTARTLALTGIGEEVLARCADGFTVGEVADDVAAAYGVPVDTAARDIAVFLGTMDAQGLISTRQGYAANVKAFLRSLVVAAPSLVQMAMLDLSTLAQPARRYPARVAYVLLACMEAQLPVLLGGFVLVAVAAGFKGAAAWTQHVPVAPVVAFAAIRPALAVTIFALLFVVHELGHLSAVRLLGMTPRSVAARMWAVGITYAPSTPWRMLGVACAGPLAAFAVASAVAGGIALAPVPSLGIGQFEVSYVFLFGGLHLWSLRPWAQDGKQAANALLSLRRGTRTMASHAGDTA